MISSCLRISVLACMLVGSEAVLRVAAPPSYDAYGVAKSDVVLDADEATAVRTLFGQAAARQPSEDYCNWEGVKCYKSGHLDEEMDLDDVEGVSECAKSLVRLQKRAISSPRGGHLEHYKILTWLTGARDLDDQDKKKIMYWRMRVIGFPVITASSINPAELGFDRETLRRFTREIREKYSQFGVVLYDPKPDNEWGTMYGMEMVEEEVHFACQRYETDSNEDKQLKDNFWRAIWTMFVRSWDSSRRATTFFMGLEGPLDKFEQTDMYKYILPAVRSYQLGRRNWKAKIYVTCPDYRKETMTCASGPTCADYVKANYFQKLGGTCYDCDSGHDQYPGDLRRCIEWYVRRTYIEDGIDVGKSGRVKRTT